MSALSPGGVLRVAINLGNPVLAQGSATEPSGVTVELARSIGAELGADVRFVCVDAARHSFEALTGGDVELAFLAVEPARAEQVAFTPPYVIIDGVYVVPADSQLTSPADVDRPGVRVGVKQGSAYDLFLTRTLERAELVRGDEGTTVYLRDGLEAAAGIRQPVTAFAATHPGHRVIDERFMQIRQAVAVARRQPDDVLAQLSEIVERLKADGSVAAWLHASGQDAAEVAPAG